jgi:hypothetical protein
VIQLDTGPFDEAGDSIDPKLSLVPVLGVYCVANGREEGLVISRPGLGSEDDVFELSTVGDLLHSVAG